MTPRALLGAASIVVLVAGAGKAGALRAALEAPTDLARCPAHCLRAAGARVTWFVDAAAGRLLSPAPRV
jgi:6-phosphogluconolactonase/glucosamine-6-phosphate isomerase/deaminase